MPKFTVDADTGLVDTKLAKTDARVRKTAEGFGEWTKELGRGAIKATALAALLDKIGGGIRKFQQESAQVHKDAGTQSLEGQKGLYDLGLAGRDETKPWDLSDKYNQIMRAPGATTIEQRVANISDVAAANRQRPGGFGAERSEKALSLLNSGLLDRDEVMSTLDRGTSFDELEKKQVELRRGLNAPARQQLGIVEEERNNTLEKQANWSQSGFQNRKEELQYQRGVANNPTMGGFANALTSLPFVGELGRAIGAEIRKSIDSNSQPTIVPTE